jgi:hypothetical protein
MVQVDWLVQPEFWLEPAEYVDMKTVSTSDSDNHIDDVRFRMVLFFTKLL